MALRRIAIAHQLVVWKPVPTYPDHALLQSDWRRRIDQKPEDQGKRKMRAKTAIVASMAILAMLSIASAHQVSPSGQRNTQYSHQPFPAWPNGDDAARYRQIPQWGPGQPKPYPHSINPGGVGTDSAL